VDCFIDADCNDGIACTSETCVNGVCAIQTNDAFCNDGTFCNGVETCSAVTGCVSPGNPCGSNPALCDEANDMCICNVPTVSAIGPRYLRVQVAASVTPVAIQVDSMNPSLACLPKYVAADGTITASPVFRTQAQWGMVNVRGAEILPGVTYEIRSDCRAIPTDPPNLSAPVSAMTWIWGDIDNNGIVDVDDIVLVVDGFAGTFTDATLQQVDLMDCVPNGTVDVDDIGAVLDAFAGLPLVCPCP